MNLKVYGFLLPKVLQRKIFKNVTQNLYLRHLKWPI